MSELKATVMIDNISKNDLHKEWGLAVHIEYGDKNILLDTGSTGVFMKNAEMLGVDMSNVDYGVLSHAHYDHSDGMEAFFGKNKKAKFYLREGTKENCYGSRWIFFKYIGIKRGLLEKFSDRIEYASGDCQLCDGVTLVPHKTPNLEAKGKRAGMFRRENHRRVNEDFSHEQSLVFDTSKGLVIFNSCSHGGADNIINEIAATFSDKHIYAIIGGFHLFKSTEQEVIALADGIRKTGIERVITGHCTGEKSFEILKRELGDCVEQICSGYVFEV